MQFFIDLFLNLDVVLQDWVNQYGLVIYVLLFLIIFMETGLVVTPFLPGDSLIFTAGMLSALPEGGLKTWVLLVVLISAAVIGDFTNYWIGRVGGRRILESGRLARIVKPKYIQQTEDFFAKHGGKTVSLARFFPFIRTFTPFVAGISRMYLLRFVTFSILGGICWVSLFTVAGHFFGTIPFVRNNLEYLVIGIVLVSLFPIFGKFIQGRLRQRKAGKNAS